MNFKTYIENAYSYDDYWQLFEKLVSEERSTWHEHNEEMVNFTKLNLQRSRRVHKKFIIENDLKERLQSIDKPVTWIAITEPWCGDAAQNLPVFAEMSKLNSKITFRLVLRDKNEELMNAFLTNGTKSIPKLIQLDEDLEVVATWGPRPMHAQNMVMDWKKNPHVDKQSFYKEVQAWYNQDNGQSLQKEILKMLESSVNV
jgi:hypothetical protein